MLGVLVGAILERRALHVVAIVEQDQVVAKLGFHLFDEVCVVGKLVITPVRIRGFDDGQGGFFLGARSKKRGQDKHNGKVFRSHGYADFEAIKIRIFPPSATNYGFFLAKRHGIREISVFLCHNSKTVCDMADLSIIVSEIETKLRRLIDEKKQLAMENKRLAEENAALDQENLALRRSVGELQDKINKSTIVNALDNEGEVEEGRKLIKELVREIDRCVSILNSKE